MSMVHPGLSIPELIKFIKHSFRESEFDEVQNALMNREKIMQIKMENLVTDRALLKKEIDLLQNTQSFTVLEKCSMEEKLGRIQRRCEELDKEIVLMGETIGILRCEKLGIEEKLESSNRKCEEMEEMLVKMGKEIGELRRDKIDVNKAMEELKRKEIEADRVVQELKLKYVEANQTIDELRVKKMESDKAAEVYGSSLNNLDPRIMRLETNLAKMLSVDVEDLPYLVHGAAPTDAEAGENVNLPNFVEGGSDGLDNGQVNADANDRVVMSPEGPATSGNSAGTGGNGLAKKGSNASAIHLGAGKAEVSSSAAGNVIVISDSDDETCIPITSSEQTNKRNRRDGGDDSVINWSRKRKCSTSSSLPSRLEERGGAACDSQRFNAVTDSDMNNLVAEND